MRCVYRTLRMWHRGESGITVAQLIAAVVVGCIMMAISVPVFMGVQRAAWDVVAQLDVKHAQNSITTYITASGGDVPPSFTKSAKPYKRTYVLADFKHVNAIADTKIPMMRTTTSNSTNVKPDSLWSRRTKALRVLNIAFLPISPETRLMMLIDVSQGDLLLPAFRMRLLNVSRCFALDTNL